MKPKASGRQPRRDRLIQEARHDPYRAVRKPSEPTACPSCGAVFRKGRWRDASASADAARRLCPACQRIADDYPAGYVTLEGSFLDEHRDEILGIALNVESREKTEHALKRIIAIESGANGGLVITTTDPQLARAIGEAIHAAYAGDLSYAYAKNEDLLRVTWRR
jgi:NMD protein affecting ribosome stability and mRNA decay